MNSIDFLRQKVKSKNLKCNFLRIDKEKSIELFHNGGWHFNNILSPEEISLKLKTFAHSEFAGREFSSLDVIEKKMKLKIDLFNRGHNYKVIEINETYPEYILGNLEKYKKFIIS